MLAFLPFKVIFWRNMFYFSRPRKYNSINNRQLASFLDSYMRKEPHPSPRLSKERELDVISPVS